MVHFSLDTPAEVVMQDHESTNGRPVKEQAMRLVEQLRHDATWDDLMYQIYVRQAIESGVADADAGRVVSVDEVRARFGLAS
jgi:hypothetical protein